MLNKKKKYIYDVQLIVLYKNVLFILKSKFN